MERLQEDLNKSREENASMRKRIAKLKKENSEAADRITYLKEYYEDVENVDHSIIAIYLRSLVAFRDKLEQIGEPNVMAQVAEKKNQMIRALEKQLREVMGR
jgi:DNA repair exonuclease SbcCD ATPase subunit